MESIEKQKKGQDRLATTGEVDQIILPDNKLSTLIDRLQKIQTDHGDIELTVVDPVNPIGGEVRICAPKAILFIDFPALNGGEIPPKVVCVLH